MTTQASAQECCTKQTSLGVAMHVKFQRQDGAPMSWRELWEEFALRYPGQWACQFFPPAEELIDEVNLYHLWVLDEPPTGVNINKWT